MNAAGIVLDMVRCECCAVYTAEHDGCVREASWGAAWVCRQCVRRAAVELHKHGSPWVVITSGRSWNFYRQPRPSAVHRSEAPVSLCVLRAVERACGFDPLTGKRI